MRITRQRFIYFLNPSRAKINTVKTQQSYVECVKRHISKDCHKRWSAHLRDADRLKFVHFLNSRSLKIHLPIFYLCSFLLDSSSSILPLTVLLSPSFHTTLWNTSNSLHLCVSHHALTRQALLLSPAVPWPLCASLHPLSSPLSLFVFLLHFLLAHFIHHAISLPMPTLLLHTFIMPVPFFCLSSMSAVCLPILPLLLLSPRTPLLLNPNPHLPLSPPHHSYHLLYEPKLIN